MPTQVQFRRGTTAQNNAFTGAAGELSINSDNNSLRIHDGSTVGGHEVAKADLSNTSGIASLSVQDLNITGLSTFVGISTYQSTLFGKQISISGVTTSNAYYVGATQVISSGRQLQNITSLDATTTSTIESAVQAAPNDFTSLNITGFSTFAGITTVSGETLFSKQLNVSGVITSFDLDINGLTRLNDLNVSGISTFVGIVTTQNNLFVGNNLSVAGNTKIVGILTVGSSSITLNGTTNEIKLGNSVILNTSTVSVNQIEVAGVSTFSTDASFYGNIGFSTNIFVESIVASVPSATTTVIDSFPYETYRSALYQVQVTTTTDYHICNLLVVHDNFTVQVNEYNQNLMYSSCGTFSGQINGSSVELLFDPVSYHESGTVIMTRTLVRTSGNALGLVGDLSSQGGVLDLNILGGNFDLNT